MKYAVVYETGTGNTKMLSECIRDCLPQAELIYFGPPDDRAMCADLLFVGFWTNKGTCCFEIEQFLNKLMNKKVFLFGTAGFGASELYFKKIAERAEQNLPPSNILLGWYLCQGKMPIAVRERYEAMAKTDPHKAKPMLDNFDKALTHPDSLDLKNLQKEVRNILNKFWE